MLFRGSFLSALGRNWHPEHFNCAGCRKSLQNKGFVEESDNLYCENCYDMKFAPHCDVCNEAIVGVSLWGRGSVEYHVDSKVGMGERGNRLGYT